ncbi:FAD-dependent monooxygenase [Streptomyces sp. NPDC050549]|uniref:FAD-dependent monooxygenase n=1 Tax=Streptomyces sp. NPDC050549 TaxID=3155406 RepID=UPI00342A3B31
MSGTSLSGPGPRIAVVGGGIGGLTTAAAMVRRGLDVTVYESADTLREDGVGMHLGPNGTRLLQRLRLSDALAREAVRPDALEVRTADGGLVVRQPMGETWETRYAAPYLTVHRGTLHHMIAALLPGGRVFTGKRLVSHEETATEVRLRFADGSHTRVDVLVGADGARSRVRRTIAGEDRPVHSGSSAFRGIVEAHRVPALSARLMYMFVGPTARLLFYPIDGGQHFTYVAVVPTAEPLEESWTSAAEPADLAGALAGWETAAARQVVAAATDVRCWGLYDREPLERWSTGRTTLLGDAAHPMLPHHGQGANQAIEDAVTLAICLAGTPRDADAVAAALQNYERVRRPHTTRVQLGSREGRMPADPVARGGSRLDHIIQGTEWIHRHDAEAVIAHSSPAFIDGK